MSDKVADGWRKGGGSGGKAWRMDGGYVDKLPSVLHRAQTYHPTFNRPGRGRESIVKFREGWVRYICYDYHSPRADGDNTVLATRSMVSLRNSMLIEIPDRQGLLGGAAGWWVNPWVFPIGKTTLQGRQTEHRASKVGIKPEMLFRKRIGQRGGGVTTFLKPKGEAPSCYRR